MKELVDGADILTPNLTEASILTGIAYEGQNVDGAYVDAMMDSLLEMGAKHVVLKGIDREDGQLRNYVGAPETPTVELAHEKLPYMLHGTGDLFCSALTAAVYCDKGIVDAARFAGDFVRDAMKITRQQPNYEERGVSFEPCLGEVATLLK